MGAIAREPRIPFSADASSFRQKHQIHKHPGTWGIALSPESASITSGDFADRLDGHNKGQVLLHLHDDKCLLARFDLSGCTVSPGSDHHVHCPFAEVFDPPTLPNVAIVNAQLVQRTSSCNSSVGKHVHLHLVHYPGLPGLFYCVDVPVRCVAATRCSLLQATYLL